MLGTFAKTSQTDRPSSMSVSDIVLDLSRPDRCSIPARSHEIRLFSVMRNEALRIPHFIKYYSEKGVDRFFVVDNGSTDETTELLTSYRNVHVFHTYRSYAEARYGMEWIEALLSSFGKDYWCIVADADELLTYPGAEQIPISQLCSYLDTERASALHCVLVDMYSDKAFSQTEYSSGEDLLKVCPFFECNTIRCHASLRGSRNGNWSYAGGMRRRVFGVTVRLDKWALIRYSSAMQLYPGMHRVKGAVASQLRGAVLHFKFLSDFPTRVILESGRHEHWRNAREYKIYSEIQAGVNSLSAYGPMSKRLSTSADLIRCGIMRCPKEFRAYLKAQSPNRTGLT